MVKYIVERLYSCWLFIPDFPSGSDSKASAYNVGDLGSIPGSGRSSGEGNGNPWQPKEMANLAWKIPWICFMSVSFYLKEGKAPCLAQTCTQTCLAWHLAQKGLKIYLMHKRRIKAGPRCVCLSRQKNSIGIASSYS